jgi:hypothetical protein
MDSILNKELQQDVRILMDPLDEAVWNSNGLFSSVDLVGVSSGLPPSNTRLVTKPGDSVGPCLPSSPGIKLKHKALSVGGPSFTNCSPLPRKGDNDVLLADRAFNSSQISPLSGIQKRAWRPNKRVRKMVLGEDVGLAETCRLAMCGIVGRLSYSFLADIPLLAWVQNTWTPLLGYVPEILDLTKGWVGFICRTPEDVSILLDRFWVLGGSSLMLKRWRVAFDPATEHFQHRHLWVLLPGLPLHFWHEGALKAIGNTLGRFISLDSTSLALQQGRWGGYWWK